MKHTIVLNNHVCYTVNMHLTYQTDNTRKQMKKRIISTILAACMVLALGACGSSATDEGKSDAESREQSTDSKQSTGLFSRKDDKSKGMQLSQMGKNMILPVTSNRPW